MSILEGELAQTITEALLDADVPFDVTVRRITTIPGENEWDPPVEVEVDYACKGFIETYSDLLRSGTLIQEGDRKVVILAPTISTTPELTDYVIVRGDTYAIASIGYDPAMATIELQVRR